MTRQVAVGGSHLSWAAVVVLGLLVAGAAIGSTFTAPSQRSVVSALSTTTAPTTTVPVGTSCAAPPGSRSITLSDMSPTPTVTISVGAELVVMVPSSPGVYATEVHIANPTLLSEQCSSLLADHGRMTVLLAVSPGQTSLEASVTPPSDLMMPAWLGQVIVQGSGSP